MLRENGTKQTKIKKLRQRVAKKPVAEITLAVKRPEEAKRLEGARRTEELASAVKD